MACAFTMFEKFGDVCSILNEDDRKELIYAISMYGMFGEEVELPYPLNAVMESLKDDIDNSKESRKKGSAGGRPKKKPAMSEDGEPGVSENEKPPVSENGKPPVSENAKPKPSQTKPNQTNPIQESGEAFAPPTVEEVEEYARSNCLQVDASRFVATYAAQGWLMGNGLPMRDWRWAVSKWSGNEQARRRAGEEASADDFGEYD